MFRSSSRALRGWWLEFSDDILGADLHELAPSSDVDGHGSGAVAGTAAGSTGARTNRIQYQGGYATTADDWLLAHHREHPHRQPLQSRRVHRPGQVPVRPGVCLSPVRTATPINRHRLEVSGA